MPRFDKDQDMEQHRAGHFGFSAVQKDKLGADKYTNVVIVADRSYSTEDFQKAMEAGLKEIVGSCAHSEQADYLMIRLLAFADNCEEIHGFKLLSDCNVGDYDGCLQPCGATALYDSALDGIESITAWAKELDEEEDIVSNGIIFVITDGWDNRSTFGPKDVGKALKDARKSETLDSLVSVLISVNHQGTTKFVILDNSKNRHDLKPADFVKESADGKEYDAYDDAAKECKDHDGCRVVPVFDPNDQLSQFDREAGFTDFLPVEDSKAGTLARLAQFISKSISSQSRKVGTGTPSSSVTF